MPPKTGPCRGAAEEWSRDPNALAESSARRGIFSLLVYHRHCDTAVIPVIVILDVDDIVIVISVLVMSVLNGLLILPVFFFPFRDGGRDTGIVRSFN